MNGRDVGAAFRVDSDGSEGSSSRCRATNVSFQLSKHFHRVIGLPMMSERALVVS